MKFTKLGHHCKQYENCTDKENKHHPAFYLADVKTIPKLTVKVEKQIY
jgi:hypothetical protein